MKIVHLCVSNFYIDGYAYQENMLIQEHVKAGYDVLVIASTETFDEHKKITYVKSSKYLGKDGAKVIRLPYRNFLPKMLMRKLRMHPNVYKILNDFKPNVIMFHGMCGFELLTVARYIKKNPHVKFYADSHEDFNNSARNFITRNTLYKFYYTPIIFLTKKYIDKVMYITIETKTFCKSVYNLKDSQLEFFPLGGVVLSDSDYTAIREEKRDLYSIENNEIIFFQSGKFDIKKKLIESISAFVKIENKRFKYFVAGSLSSDISEEFYRLMENDNRIKYLGWVNSEELTELLCMADVYVQPGSQSATMQMSLAARCAVILDDVPSHRHIFCENGFLLNDNKKLEEVFDFISQNPSSLIEMKNKSYDFAKSKLDYFNLAKRLLR